jgi:integrase
MSVRKRKWTTSSGVNREAWVVDYVDGAGARRLKTFDKKKEADAFEATATVEIRDGVHIADAASVTVREAGLLWIESAKAVGLERSTVEQYETHLREHINPLIGGAHLGKLNLPAVRNFEDRLRTEEHGSDKTVKEGKAHACSPAMVRKVLGSLGSLLADAQERGLVVRNVVRDMRGRRQRGKERRAERRQNGRLKVGFDIPTRAEIKAIIEKLDGRWRPILVTAIFSGLRASELRGLPWSDVDLTKREIHVRQRADRFNQIGRPKSEAGERTVPIPPLVANTLTELKLRGTKSKQDLVFANGAGKVESHANIVNRGLIPVQLAAGLTVQASDEDGKPRLDEEGEPKLRAKYTGLHSLRHWYASWLINRQEDGGLGLTAKIVQERMGHSSITMTMDTYGHLFPRGDDAEELAAAERALLA